jgi:O-antigen ligase
MSPIAVPNASSQYLGRWTGILNHVMLAFAAMYLALMPTNAWTYARSLSFGIAGAIALAALIGSLSGRNERTPPPGTYVLLFLALWSAWSVASITWSVNPDYSAEQLKREVGWSLVTVLIFYMSARSVYSWRVLLITAIGAFVVYAALALAMAGTSHGWDPSRWHSGVGPYSTEVVLVAPLLLAFLVPLPAGFGGRRGALLLLLVTLVLMVASARLTENRMVWIALAATFATASALAAWRWRPSMPQHRLRWIAPLVLLLCVLGALFIDAAHERATADFPPKTTIAQTLSEDPRLPLWDHTLARVMARPWTGFGFGRAILADQLKGEMGNPTLWHAHNMLVSQWMQTGAVGLALFVGLLVALVARFVRFLRSRNDSLAFIGIMGVTLIVGFVVKNLTDDFLFRSNAKEFWALLAILVGFGTRIESNAGTVDVLASVAPVSAGGERAASPKPQASLAMRAPDVHTPESTT